MFVYTVATRSVMKCVLTRYDGATFSPVCVSYLYLLCSYSVMC